MKCPTPVTLSDLKRKLLPSGFSVISACGCSQLGMDKFGGQH